MHCAIKFQLVSEQETTGDLVCVNKIKLQHLNICMVNVGLTKIISLNELSLTAFFGLNGFSNGGDVCVLSGT